MNKRRRRNLILGIVALLFIAGGILCILRWKTWFANPVEFRFVLASYPQRVMLTFGNAGEFSRNVSWVCGGASRKGRLEYTCAGTNDTLFVDASTRFLRTIGGYTFVNWAHFGKLLPERTYSYRVCSGQEASPWYSFTMQPDTTRNFSFVFIGDVQDTIGGVTHEYMENVRKQLPQAEFYMFVGDFAERPMNVYWEEAYKDVDSIAPYKPLLVAAGNHEYIKGLKRKLSMRFAYAFSYYMDSRYKGNNVYALDYKDAAIFVLDSTRDPVMLLSQREWLKERLEASKQKWKIVMLHHPIYSIKGRMNNLSVRMIFGSLLEDYKVDLVLEGHEHNYARMTTPAEDGQRSTPIHIISHASPKTYSLYFNDRYDRLGTNHRFYQSIDVQGDTLQLRTFLEDNSLYDDVCIVKDGTHTQVIDNAVNIPESLEMPWLKGKKAMAFEEKVNQWRKHQR